MVNVDKQVAYWRSSAEEEWAVAQELLEHGRTRHGLFFIHLALEKALKALVCRYTADLAPRTHNLVRLSTLTGAELSDEQLELLAEMNQFQLEGRYPDALSRPPTPQEARDYQRRTEPLLTWLIQHT